MLRGMWMPSHAIRAALACGILGSVGGCAYGEMRQVLRAQVATEADCPDLVVQKASPYSQGYQPNQYVVRGCGVDRLYTCKEDDGLVKFGSADCTYTKRGVPAAAPTPEPAAEPSADDLGAEES